MTTATTDLNRPHYVYRLFDDRARLLYVGCAIDPFKRWQQHVNREFWPYVAHADVRGPWDRQVALRIETKAIESEGSFFNVTKVRDKARREHNRQVSRAMARDHWERPSYEDPDWSELAGDYYDAVEAYSLNLRDQFPPMDSDNLLDLYLRSLAVGVAA